MALAVALWFASTLGLMHRTLHVPGHERLGAGQVQAAASAVPGDVAQAAVPHGLARLFGHHTSDADCRLYDQLAHGSAAPAVPFVALPVLLPAATFVWLQGEIFARWVALLRARGPPLSR